MSEKIRRSFLLTAYYHLLGSYQQTGVSYGHCLSECDVR